MGLFNQIITIVSDRKEYLVDLLIQHIYLSLIAILIIALLGVSAGIYALKHPAFRKIVIGVVNFLYTIPSIAMFGIFIPLVGIGYGNALVVLVIYGLLPVIRNTYTGLSSVDPLLVDAAKGMGATPRQIFVKVRWPLAFPTIFSGFRTMVIMTIALAGLASFIGAGGLGQAIYRGINTNNPAMILVGSLSVAILALVTDLVLGGFENRITRKTRGEKKKSKGLLWIVFFLLAMLGWVTLSRIHTNQPSDQVVVATKPTAEQFILGEIISQTIENHTDLQVVRKFGIGGGSANIHPALLSGDVDIYPEYSGTAWLTILHHPPEKDANRLYQQLQTEYAKRFHLIWVCRLGFNNTYTLAMPDSLAEIDSISTFSDLARVSSNHKLGAEFDFYERQDGFPGLKKLYGFHFAKKVELDVNLKFQAIQNQTVDVINAFSTDSRVARLNLRILKDDQHYFPAYEAGIVIRKKNLDAYPELGPILKSLENQIPDQTMLRLNNQVENEHQSPEDVARKFLIQKGLIDANR